MVPLNQHDLRKITKQTGGKLSIFLSSLLLVMMNTCRLKAYGVIQSNTNEAYSNSLKTTRNSCFAVQTLMLSFLDGKQFVLFISQGCFGMKKARYLKKTQFLQLLFKCILSRKVNSVNQTTLSPRFRNKHFLDGETKDFDSEHSEVNNYCIFVRTSSLVK